MTVKRGGLRHVCRCKRFIPRCPFFNDFSTAIRTIIHTHLLLTCLCTCLPLAQTLFKPPISTHLFFVVSKTQLHSLFGPPVVGSACLCLFFRFQSLSVFVWKSLVHFASVVFSVTDSFLLVPLVYGGY